MGGFFGMLGNLLGGVGTLLGELLRNTVARIVIIVLGLMIAIFVGLSASLGGPQEAVRLVTNVTSGPDQRAQSLQPVFVDIPAITVPLRREAGARIARAQISVQVPSDAVEDIQRIEVAIVDKINDFFMTIDENDLEGSAGIFRVRAEVMRRIRLLEGGEDVQDVLFTELLIQ